MTGDELPGRHATECAISDLGEVRSLQDRLEAALEAAGYDAHDQFAVKLAVEEAVVTALKRNGFDPDLRVRVRFTVTQDRLDVRVSAEGSR